MVHDDCWKGKHFELGKQKIFQHPALEVVLAVAYTTNGRCTVANKVGRRFRSARIVTALRRLVHVVKVIASRNGRGRYRVFFRTMPLYYLSIVHATACRS